MSPLKMLNIGCGTAFHPSWINIDFESFSSGIHKQDIRKGLPYANHVFDACYCSHVLEHLKRSEAGHLIRETYRVLKPGGIFRLVVPDLEKIAREYLLCLEKAWADGKNAEADYDWMMLELYDQTVRYFSGGEMGKHLRQPNIPNKEFILSRIGSEADQYWINNSVEKTTFQKIRSVKLLRVFKKSRYVFAKMIVRLIAGKEAEKSFEEGWFRNSGEIHGWMYDRFSIHRLLSKSGFTDIKKCEADESRIPEFKTFSLDMVQGKIRKPDSLFMEGIKP